MHDDVHALWRLYLQLQLRMPSHLHDNMPVKICPTCKQPLPEVRLGAALTPIKAGIFDLIKLSGEEGCPTESINRKIWDGRSNRRNIQSHVNQINELIESSGYRIRASMPRYGYRLIKAREMK